MKNGRIVFLDWMRVAACFMVMAIHSAEPFYLGGAEPNVTQIASGWDMLCITMTECICRCCVPLFAMASAYLLFPLNTPTGEFFRRRLVRVVIPFVVWAVPYVAFLGGGGS
ncbi:MAG: acyltransferase, partial [Kiritimatiellae bacterium]|nr:acyltransferase [Kiritimatiellia bacterium]